MKRMERRVRSSARGGDIEKLTVRTLCNRMGRQSDPPRFGPQGGQFGVIVLSVQNMAIAGRRAACSEVFRRNAFRAIGVFISP